NLDAKLREKMRFELKRLQRELRITTVYVTHDQSEALALSDRIAVMNHGRIVQLADPYTIYERPADPFVADFIGSSNFFRGTALDVAKDRVRVEIGEGRTLLAHSAVPVARGTPVAVSVRPERIELLDGTDGGGGAGGGDGADRTNTFEVEIQERTFLGSHHSLLVRAGGDVFRVECRAVPDGASAFVRIPAEACIVFPAPPDNR
ncbi:MAG TPA: ABC transporter ATP-binding protein, partial [Gaiellaceae bacterium]|nr:ABC transporter ATP-binding protein [Gaiellaceae bacterium]